MFGHHEESAPIPFRLTRKGWGTKGYHPMSDDWVPSPWDCSDSGALTVRESLTVLREHATCGPECHISRTARKVRARLIDAPTVRSSVYTRAVRKGGKFGGLWPILTTDATT